MKISTMVLAANRQSVFREKRGQRIARGVRRAWVARSFTALLVVLVVAAVAGQAWAQEAQPTPMSFWVDPETGQVFTKPGTGRVPLNPRDLTANEQKLEQQEGQILKLEEQVAGITSGKGIQLGGVNVKLGGFIEAAGIYRTRNEVADIGSDFNTGIPFRSSVLAHENETRFTARQSRLSLLVSGDVDPQTHLAGYYETDFLTTGTSSNSRESNSYALRSRQLWASLDKSDWGFHLLVGQAWSLLTTNNVGILPRQEQIPLTIDAQYVVGFNWDRNPQFRVVEDWGSGLWTGLSVESPQLVTSQITAPNGVNITNPGGSLLNSTTQYSADYIPDIVEKIALDPFYGHYELKGLQRWFYVRSGSTNHTTLGWGVGGAATLPVLPKYVELQLSGLAGHGIGRYGSGQLPDAAFNDNASLVAIPEVQGLFGVIGHPWTGNDIYVYGGWEHASPAGTQALLTNSMGGFVGAPGYGSPQLNVSGCNVQGGTCQAQTETLQEITSGFWQDIYKGSYGRFAFGFQGAWLWRTGFEGIGGKPGTNIAIFDVAFRYYPFT